MNFKEDDIKIVQLYGFQFFHNMKEVIEILSKGGGYTDLRSVNRIDLIDFCLCFLARVVEELMSFRLKKVATQNFV